MMDDITIRLMKLKAQGFCCAQIMIVLALEEQGRTNVELVRSASGLCWGMHAGEICGVFSGGACLISLYAGKGESAEEIDYRHVLMMNEFAEWFKGVAEEDYGGIRCDEILKKYPDRSICGLILTDTYRKCIDILKSHGFDPSAGSAGSGHAK